MDTEFDMTELDYTILIKDRGGLFRIRELRNLLFRQKLTVTSNLTSTKRQLKRGKTGS